MSKREHVVRVDDEASAVIDAYAKKYSLMSRSEAASALVMYAHRRMEALRKDREKRLAAASAPAE